MAEDIFWIRYRVEQRLSLPPIEYDETPSDFWWRVKKAGLLSEALRLYDEISAEDAATAQIRRETKAQFAERIEQEGRKAEADKMRAELLASGWSQRDVQVELVEHFQPLDGTETRVWETPNPWENGRLFQKKADHERLAAESKTKKELEEYRRREAKRRIRAAKQRRAESTALENARLSLQDEEEEAAAENKASAPNSASA